MHLDGCASVLHFPRMAVNPENTSRKIFSLPKAVAEAVENYRFEHRCKTESEAIRRLVEAGLRLDTVYAHMSDLECALLEWATRAGASEQEMDDLTRWTVNSRRLTEPLGPDTSPPLKLDITKEEAEKSLEAVRHAVRKK